MTAKIKLTQGQADAIELAKRECGVNRAIELHAGMPDGWMTEKYDPLNDFSQADLARALLIGYEVEPVFKIGDKVFVVRGGITDPNKVYEITNLDETHASLKGVIGAIGLNNLRHATLEEVAEYEERRKWSEISRAVGEIKEGDIGEANAGRLIFSKSEIEAAYSHGALKGLYPIEKFVDFWGDDHE